MAVTVLFVWLSVRDVPFEEVGQAIARADWLVLFGASLTDPHFARIVTRPDNVPIVAMVFLLGFFTWLATAQAVRNDRRMARGLPPREKEYGETVFAWPDVVYLELIGLVVATAVLIVWSLLLRAPLQGPANPVGRDTRIRFTLYQSAPVRLDVYDLRGRRVRSLVSESRLEGSYSELWDGTDRTGSPVPTGVYLCRLQAGQDVVTRKVSLIR